MILRDDSALSCVYVAETGNGWVKVGRTVDIRMRLRTLRSDTMIAVADRARLRLVAAYSSDQGTVAFEQMVHGALRSSGAWTLREWYKMSAADVVDVLDACADLVNNIPGAAGNVLRPVARVTGAG